MLLARVAPLLIILLALFISFLRLLLLPLKEPAAGQINRTHIVAQLDVSAPEAILLAGALHQFLAAAATERGCAMIDQSKQKPMSGLGV
jgi:hypothetical protein